MIDPLAPDFSDTPISPARRPGYYHAPCAKENAIIDVVLFASNDSAAFQASLKSLELQTLSCWSLLIVGASEETIAAVPANWTYATSTTFPRTSACRYRIILSAGTLLEPAALEKMVWCLEANPNYSLCSSARVTYGQTTNLDRIDENYENKPLPTIAPLCGTVVRGELVFPDEINWESINSKAESSKILAQLTQNNHYNISLAEHLVWQRGEALADDTGHNRAAELPHAPQLADCLSSQDWHTSPFQNPVNKTGKGIRMFVCPLEIGGSTKFNRDLSEDLVNHGWDVSLVITTPQRHSWLPVFAKLTPNIFILNRYMEMASYFRFVCYLIESRQPEVVLITHSGFGYDVLPLMKHKYPHIQFVDYVHVHREHFGEGGYAKISASWNHLLDLTIVSSEQLKRYISNFGVAPQKIEVAYTNIDTQQIKPDSDLRRTIRRELGISPDTPVILFAGRFEEQKQPQVLLRTLEKLHHEHNADFIALLAGDGDYKEWMLDFVAEKQLHQKIWFLGKLPNTATTRLMKACDIFFLPSKWEGISLAFYEAMASALVVVGSNVGGQAELVTPDCGILVEVENEESEIARYTEHLLALITNPERRAAMQQQARTRICNSFELSQMGERMRSLLENVTPTSSQIIQNVTDEVITNYFVKLVAAELAGIDGQRAIEEAKKIGGQFKSSQANFERAQADYQRISLQQQI